MRCLPARAFLVVLAGAAHGSTPFAFNLPSGSHAVGLRVVLQYDY